jgi:hypothetical protein
MHQCIADGLSEDKTLDVRTATLEHLMKSFSSCGSNEAKFFILVVLGNLVMEKFNISGPALKSIQSTFILQCRKS